MLVAERAGRRDVLRALDVELLAAGEPGDLLLELGPLDPRREQGLAQLLADLLRGVRDLGDVDM